FGCSSKKSFEKSLYEMIDFIKIHNNEIILLKISHTAAPAESVIKMLDRFTQSAYEKYFYKSNVDRYNWVDNSIYELRGKIILLLDCEFNQYLNPKKGYFSYSTNKNNHCNADDDDKIIYDKYSNTLNFDFMYSDQLAKLEQHGRDRDKLFLLS